MTAPRRALVDWAVSGKKPGGFDQRILHASTPETAGTLGNLLEQVNPGTPDRSDGAGAALPWVTVANFSTLSSPAPLLAVCATELGEGFDSGNRQIMRTRIFALPASTGPAPHPGYQAVWAALRDWDLAEGTDGQVPVDLPGGVEPDRDLFLRAGTTFEWAAAVAAALLDRRVLITDYPGQDPSEALGVIDAVVSLLPRGLSQGFTAGTWTKNSTVVTDLAFASASLGCTPDSCWKIAWNSPDPLSAVTLTDEAARYLGHLYTLYHEYQRDPLPIVQGLAAVDTPHGMGGCAPWALSVIEALNLPLLTYQTITDREGRVRRGQDHYLAPQITTPSVLGNVTAVMHQFEVTHLPAARAEALAEYIAWHPDPAALADVPADWWAAALGHTARLKRWRLRDREDWQARGPASVAWFLNAVEFSRANGLGDPAGKADLLWSTLLPLVTDEPIPAASFVQLWTTWTGRAADALPRTAKLLAGRENLARSLLVQECQASPSGAIGLLALLDSGARPGAWHEVLRIAYREDDFPTDPDQIDAFCQADPDHPLLLLQVAAITNRLELVAQEAADGLVGAALELEKRGERKSALELYVQTPVRTDAGPSFMALTDLIRWILHLQFTGSSLAGLRVREDAAAYVEALLDLTTLDRGLAHLRAKYASYLARKAFEKVKELPAWTEPVLFALLRSDSEAAQQVAEAVAQAAPKSHDLAKLVDRFDREFMLLLAQYGGPAQQRFLRAGLLTRVSDAVRTGLGEPVAQACAEALRGGCQPEEVLSTLSALPWRTEVDEVRALCNRVRALSEGSGEVPGEVSFLARALDFAIDGTWGPVARQRFADYVITELTELQRQRAAEAAEQEEALRAQEWQANRELTALNEQWALDKQVIDDRAEEELNLATNTYVERAEDSKRTEELQIQEIRRRGEAERLGFEQEFTAEESRIKGLQQTKLVRRKKEYQQFTAAPSQQREAAQQALAAVRTQSEMDQADLDAQINRVFQRAGADRSSKSVRQSTRQKPNQKPNQNSHQNQGPSPRPQQNPYPHPYAAPQTNPYPQTNLNPNPYRNPYPNSVPPQPAYGPVEQPTRQMQQSDLPDQQDKYEQFKQFGQTEPKGSGIFRRLGRKKTAPAPAEDEADQAADTGGQAW